METNSQPEPPNEPLQFDRVEPVSKTATTAATCAGCHQPITNAYYEIGGRPLCERCNEGLLAAYEGGSGIARFFKALLFGFLAALISAAVWIAIIKLTGYEVGLVAIIVGLFVGAAVRKGANGRGGWVYQGMAIILTYLAITGSYVPLLIEGIGQVQAQYIQQLVSSDAERSRISISRDGAVTMNGKTVTVEEAVQEVQRLQSANGIVLYHREGHGETVAPSSAEVIGGEWEKLEVPAVYYLDADCQAIELDTLSFGKAPLLGKATLLLVGFYYAVQSPFLGGAAGLIGVLIIGFGLLQAWRMNKRPIFNITGPHMLAPPLAMAHVATPMAMPLDEANSTAWTNNPTYMPTDEDRQG